MIDKFIMWVKDGATIGAASFSKRQDIPSSDNSNFQYDVLSERKDREIQREEREESRSNWIHKDRIEQIYWTK